MTKKMVIGGGCFWGMEELIKKQLGVLDTEVGYAGGENDNPTYKNHPGHAEVVQIEYDQTKTSYTKLFDFFFQIHDPTTLNRQGNDQGTSYRSVIFYTDSEEKTLAEKMIKIVNKSGRWENSVVTSLEPLKEFYKAEEYHQDYLQKNPRGYTCHFIRFGTYL